MKGERVVETAAPSFCLSLYIVRLETFLASLHFIVSLASLLHSAASVLLFTLIPQPSQLFLLPSLLCCAIVSLSVFFISHGLMR